MCGELSCVNYHSLSGVWFQILARVQVLMYRYTLIQALRCEYQFGFGVASSWVLVVIGVYQFRVLTAQGGSSALI